VFEGAEAVGQGEIAQGKAGEAVVELRSHGCEPIRGIPTGNRANARFPFSHAHQEGAFRYAGA
jgi:hypothetical protein